MTDFKMEFEVEVLRVFEHFVPDLPSWSMGWFIEVEAIDECLRVGRDKPELEVGQKLLLRLERK